MTFLKPAERRFLGAVSGIAFGNPFLPDRVALEREALGDDFVAGEEVWSFRSDPSRGNRNVTAIGEKTEALLPELRRRLAQRNVRPVRDELALYEDLAAYALFSRYQFRIYELILRTPPGEPVVAPFYADFARDFDAFLRIGSLPSHLEPAPLFASFFQVRRAFHHIFDNIIGSSLAAARLRAAVWESIFTRDMRRFQRSLVDRMSDVPTLVTGPTGTGKELVARAIGLSRFIPFDERLRRFAVDPSASFFSVNLSALAPTIIESELFGHRKGAFTGALQDRKGWLEACGPLGTVFLDEIGELDPSIQVKLLRVLQTRTFQRLGDTATRQFPGKIIAATHRDLAVEIEAGRLREDFFYRLCADSIATPALREQLATSPGELENLTRFIARRVAGEEEEERLSREVIALIERELGRDYAWPGNFRELEQCVRSVMVRGEYRPLRLAGGDLRTRLTRGFLGGTLTADELLGAYCTLVYAEMRNYVDVAERLGLDRRTVKARIDRKLLEEIRSGALREP